jgi:putative methionine-R-sulfoxide reductase with GAF domain
MSRQLGLLERARLEQEFDQAKARAEKLRILHGLGMAIASAMDLEQLLTRIVEAAVFITQAEEGSLLLLDEDTQELHLRAQKGLGDKYARGFRIPVRDSIAGEVLQSTRPQSLTSTNGSVKVVTGYLVNAILYVPVAIKGRSIGVLAVDNQAAERPFTEDDENLLLVLAGYAAIALENARLLDESQRRFQTLAALHGAGQFEPGLAAEADVSGIRVGGGGDPAVSQALTPSYLAMVVSPCLRAIADLQYLLDELTGRSPREVRVLAITQDWPVPVSLQGAPEAMQALELTILPWAEEYAAGRKDVVIELAVSLVDSTQPGLRDTELIGYVARLLPVLETLLASPLEVSAVSG